jgi:hypothetical protein
VSEGECVIIVVVEAQLKLRGFINEVTLNRFRNARIVDLVGLSDSLDPGRGRSDTTG